MRLLAILAGALLLLGPYSFAQEQILNPVLECSHKQRLLVMQIAHYAHSKNGVLPTDIASAFDEARSDEWKQEHARYQYVGIGGISYSELPEWGSIAITHLDLDMPHVVEPTEFNPEGRLITVGFADGHTESMRPADAERIIRRSRAIFEALRDNTPLPEREQVLGDLNAIAYAVHQYTRENHGLLPLNQGEIFSRMRGEGRYAKAADRARAFLIPRVRANTFVPEDPTPEWVMDRTSYTYLAGAGILIGEIPDTHRMILMHGPLDADIEHQRRNGAIERCVPVLTADCQAGLLPRETAEVLIHESTLVFDAMDRGRPLPPYQHALRDLVLLHKAIAGYARANQGRLPRDLGSTLEYLPPLPKGMSKAQVYLSPRAEASREPPQEPTAEWINRYATYKYLGGEATVTLRELGSRGVDVLLHGPADEVYEVLHAHGITEKVVPICGIHPVPFGTTAEGLETRIVEARENIRKPKEP